VERIVDVTCPVGAHVNACGRRESLGLDVGVPSSPPRDVAKVPAGTMLCELDRDHVFVGPLPVQEFLPGLHRVPDRPRPGASEDAPSPNFRLAERRFQGLGQAQRFPPTHRQYIVTPS
jgi:hypothetical protein